MRGVERKGNSEWLNKVTYACNPRLQAVLQSYNHQDSTVLAQEQTLRSMEQNRNTELDPQMYGQLIFDQKKEDPME